jgi:hypothetical protein
VARRGPGLTPAGLGSPGGLAGEVVACAERTLSVPRAGIELSRGWKFSWPQDRHTVRRRGGLLRPVGRLAKTAGKAAGKAAWRRWTEGHDPSHLSAEGLIEPAARRHMIDFGSYAEVYKDGKRWGGRSGRSLATLDPWPPDHQIDLWWLLDALRGTTAARAEGEEALHGARCRRIAAQVDLARASALRDEGLRVPSVERFEDLNDLRFTVWIDALHIRRVVFREGDETSSTLTLDLTGFEPEANDIDWERLPTFRSPEEAAYIAGERDWPMSERLIARLFGGRG